MTKFRRTERDCYHLLIKTYLDRKDYDNAAAKAEDYLSVYEEYPSRYEVHREAGEAYEALQQWDKAASHYEEFLRRLNLGNETKSRYEEKLNQIKNKMN